MADKILPLTHTFKGPFNTRGTRKSLSHFDVQSKQECVILFLSCTQQSLLVMVTADICQGVRLVGKGEGGAPKGLCTQKGVNETKEAYK